MELRIISKKKLEKEREEIRLETERLYKIKSILEETSNKIDISNVYVLNLNKIKYLVYLKKEQYDSWSFTPFLLKLINIFNNEVLIDVDSKYELYNEISLVDSFRNRVIKGSEFGCDFCSIKHVIEVEPTLCAYADNLVPDYVLRELLMRINNVDTNHPLLMLKSKNKK